MSFYLKKSRNYGCRINQIDFQKMFCKPDLKNNNQIIAKTNIFLSFVISNGKSVLIFFQTNRKSQIRIIKIFKHKIRR